MTHPYDSTCPCAACRHTSLALSARRSGMQIPENITKHHGIEASALGQVGADEPAVYCGLDSWRPLIGAALLLLRHTDENVVRIMTGTHTILVMRNAERQAAAVVVTGNPISKSLPRMLRGALNMTSRILPRSYCSPRKAPCLTRVLKLREPAPTKSGYDDEMFANTSR